MSELPHMTAHAAEPVFSIEQQWQFHAHLLDHSRDNQVSAITNMID